MRFCVSVQPMLLRNFYVNIIIRVLGIVLNSLAIAACAFWKPDWLIMGNLIVLLVLQVFLLIQKLNRLNHDLESFFEAMRSNDTSIVFTGKRKYPSFRNLYQQFEKINHDFQRIKIENHRQNEYFRVLVEHINVGVIAFTGDERITLCNRSAKELLRKPNLFRLADLEGIQSGLSELVRSIRPSQQKLVTLYRESELLQLSIRSAWIRIQDEMIKLVSFQNIRNELDEKELESWQKLIRVLTHELMNSAGPINSTISTIAEFLTTPDGRTRPLGELNDAVINDTVQGIRIIEERSRGMMDFVTRFRSLTLLPTPSFSTFPVAELFRSIDRLMSEQMQNQSIQLEVAVKPEHLEVTADRGMMEQILINLVSNAIHATNAKPIRRIRLNGATDANKRIIIQVVDNGSGIPYDIQDKVFVPFFTTRRDGSGVGLSLSRQLARIQGGMLTFMSVPGEGAAFELTI